MNTLLANKSNYGNMRDTSAIKYIVLHYTGNETDTAENNCKYFHNNVVKASAHYFVDSDSVWRSVPDNYTAYSVGKNYGSNNLFGTVTNKNSINIEMCSQKGAITTKTQERAIKLVKSLMAKYDVPFSNIVRHYDVCTKQCPGWGGWYGKTAPKWEAFKEACKPETTAKKYVQILSPLNMRKSADLKASIVTVLPKGSKVQWDKKNTIDGRTWYHVIHGTQKGWVSKGTKKTYLKEL